MVCSFCFHLKDTSRDSGLQLQYVIHYEQKQNVISGNCVLNEL